MNLPLTGQTALIDSLSTMSASAASTHTNVWMWVAIAEFVIIMILLIAGTRRPKFEKKQELRKTAEGNVDFGNLINSSFNAKALYDELKVRCHPDRFPEDPEKNRLANEIFQEISKNRNNLKRLQELKTEAIDKLGITY